MEEAKAPLPPLRDASAAATAAGIAISPGAGKFCTRSGPLFSTPHRDPAGGFELTAPRSPVDDVGPQSPYWSVAFADELFQDGRNILPLKLPPRLQHTCPSTSSGGRSPLPGSSWQRLLLCVPGGGHKKDFDPFTAALKRVRKADPAGAGGGEGRRRRGFPATRRTRSLSPLGRATWGGGGGSEGRRAPRLQGPVLASPASWTGATHGDQAMETSSEGSSGSETRSAEGDGEGGGVEDAEFFGSAAAAVAREGGGGGLRKKAFAVSSWRALFLCMRVPGAFSKEAP